MPDQSEPKEPTGNLQRPGKTALRIVTGIVLVAVLGFRVYSYNQEWDHHKEKGYEVGARFREDLLENRLDAAYESTTASFKERWSRNDLEAITGQINVDSSTQKLGFSIHGGFWSNFLRGHLRTEYPIALEEESNLLRLTIVEKDGILKVNGMALGSDQDE